MEFGQAIVLAVVQGITEFLPVSSSAHLILIPLLTDWEDQGLAFDVAVHFGTLVAVCFYFRQDIWRLFSAWVRNFTRLSDSDVSLSWCIIIATVPVGLTGVLLDDWIESHLRSTLVIAVATIVFGLLLGYAAQQKGQKSLISMTLKVAIIIGLFQVLALIPGTSRSGITITAALLMGFNMVDSARFSFLLSIPVILAASLLQTLKLLQLSQVDWGLILLATIVSGLSAWLCIRWFLKAIERFGMMPFVIYRLGLGAILLLITFA